MVCVYDISVFGVCDIFVGLAVLMGINTTRRQWQV
jgi:hypothetical protein